MARQAGPIYFTGTIGDLIFYKQGDNYFVRQKGSYNTKALQKPGARPLMQLKQAEFGKASTLAREVYWRQLPRQRRGHGVHGELTKIARQLLREGKSEAEVKTLVVPLYLGEPTAVKKEQQATTASVTTEKLQLGKPVETPKKNQPACTTLSQWRVSTKGVLKKDTGIEHDAPDNVDRNHTVSAKQETCKPCVFRELRPRLKERGG